MPGKHISAILVALGMVISMKSAVAAKETGFIDRVVKVGRTSYRYQVYVPISWSKSKKWPVILFLHGAGERGDDGLLQTQVGIATAIRLHAERFPSIVVLPQCRKNVWWSEAAMEAQALKALDRSVKEYNGDPDRIYLTGLSMGGYGTWSLASKFPRKFAALAPICGGIRPPRSAPGSPAGPSDDPSIDPYAAVAQKVGKIPIWIFHGTADNAVPVSESRKMNEALRAVGGIAKYTEYEGVGHNSWDRAYGEPELMTWLLSQRRQSR